MARRHRAKKWEIHPDPAYGDRDITRFINKVMRHGKKSVAERIVYGALTEIEARTKKNPLQSFRDAVENARPALEVRSRRVGGATYQVPVEVRPSRAKALAFRWIINAARSRGERTMTERLCIELIEASSQRGAAIKKREDTHKMAEANRAFSHYRW